MDSSPERARGSVTAAPPTGAIRLLLGFSPGSASDIVAQTIAPALSQQLGQTVVVEHYSGENGAIAAGMVARAAHDGQTLFMATLGTHAIAPCIRKGLAYHPLRDFVPVSLVARAPLVLAVHPQLPAGSVAELIALARSSRRALTFASSAMWGAPHLAGELFSVMAGVEMTHVPYDDTRRLYAELIDGRVDLSFNNVMSMRPHIEAGRLRGLATTGVARCTVLPGLPTLAEAGLPGCEVLNWLGICVPAGTPHDVAQRLSQALASALHAAEVFDVLTGQGMEIVASSPGEFALHIAREIERWKPILHRIIVK